MKGGVKGEGQKFRGRRRQCKREVVRQAEELPARYTIVCNMLWEGIMLAKVECETSASHRENGECILARDFQEKKWEIDKKWKEGSNWANVR